MAEPFSVTLLCTTGPLHQKFSKSILRFEVHNTVADTSTACFTSPKLRVCQYRSMITPADAHPVSSTPVSVTFLCQSRGLCYCFRGTSTGTVSLSSLCLHRSTPDLLNLPFTTGDVISFEHTHRLRCRNITYGFTC